MAALSLALAESGAPVLELTPRHATLEDLFFQLTEGDGPEPSAARRGSCEERHEAGSATVYRWELRKLRAQKRTYLGPRARRPRCRSSSSIALVDRSGSPNDVAFGRYVHDTGLAIPLVLLLFGSIWLFPLITALVAGRHRRRRGPQRHPEDDPHPLGRAPARSSRPRRSRP